MLGGGTLSNGYVFFQDRGNGGENTSSGKRSSIKISMLSPKTESPIIERQAIRRQTDERKNKADE